MRTGVADVDREILLAITDDSVLLRVSSVDRRAVELCNRSFWYERIRRRFGICNLSVEELRLFYFGAVHRIANTICKYDSLELLKYAYSVKPMGGSSYSLNCDSMIKNSGKYNSINVLQYLLITLDMRTVYNSWLWDDALIAAIRHHSHAVISFVLKQNLVNNLAGFLCATC